MNETFRLRAARREDARVIAGLYRISSDGVADYIWTLLAEPGDSPLDVGERRYAREGTPFSYENCTLAEAGDGVVGMLVAFPMDPEPAAPDPDEDPVLAPFSRLEQPGSYYVCGVAVVEAWRGKGLGTRLMALAHDEARARGHGEVSLIVFEQNEGALRLYRRLGYREVAREKVVPHPLIHYTGDALLMVADV